MLLDSKDKPQFMAPFHNFSSGMQEGCVLFTLQECISSLKTCPAASNSVRPSEEKMLQATTPGSVKTDF